MLAQKLQHEVEPPTQHYADLDPFWTAVIVTATHRETAERFKDAAELRSILGDGEQSAWWLARTEDRATPGAQPALKRLRLQREVSLIGRGNDLARVRDIYGRIGDGGRVLLVGGASGVGKSRLIYEFLEGIAAAGGPAIAAGRSVGQGGRSYHPFVEAMRDLLGVEGHGEEGTRTALEERLSQLLTSTPGMVEPLAGFLLGDVGAGGESMAKDALLAAFAEVARQIAREKPLVIVIEDLQLAGPESLDLFAYLARCIAEFPILLVGIYTEEEVDEGSDLHEFITQAATQEGRDLIAVAPLDVSATDELVGAVVLHAATRLKLAYPLHHRSDGNPLVVLELLNHLRESGALEPLDEGFRLVRPLDEADLPAGLQEVVNLKLGRLDEEQREVLEAAAILGYLFEAPLLASVLEIKKIKLLQKLAVLERKFRLLKSSGRNSFRFANHQMQEAVYESISPALRTEYHAVVAEAMQDELDDDEPDPETAHGLLRHLLLSDQALQGEPYLEPALEYVGSQLHAGVAAHFLERLREAFAIARPAARLAIATRLWHAYEILSQHSDELRVLDEAQPIAEELGEPGPRGRILSCLAATHWLAGAMDKVEEEAPRALELLREADDRLWIGKALQTMGGLAYRRGQPEEAARVWREALELRREIGDRRGEISSMIAVAAVMPAIGEAEQSLPTKRAALAIAREIGERRFEVTLLNNIAGSLQHEHDTEGAIDSIEQAVALSRELGDQSAEAVALGNLGTLYASAGQVDRAKSCLSRAIEVFQEIDRPTSEAVKRIHLGEILAAFGDRKRAQEELRKATQIGIAIDNQPAVAAAQRALGRFLHEWGKRDDGWNHLMRALEIDESLQDDEGRATTLSLMGHARLNERQFDEAAALLRNSLAATKGPGNGDTLLTQCRLAAALDGAGRTEEAREYTTRAERLLAELGSVSAEQGPEIHFRLSSLTEDEEAAKLHLTTADNLLASRAQLIRNGGYREHFLTQSGHNPAIIEAAKRATD